MATPPINIPIRVTGMDNFRQQMNQTTILAANATRAVAEFGIKASAGFLASQGAAGAATLAFGRMLGVIRPIAIGITALIDTYTFLKTAVEQANIQIERFSQIATKAAGAGVGTDFFQRFTQSAPKAVLSIDQATEALQRFNQVSTDRLEGSDLQQRINELTKAGNFKGNSGVTAFGAATDSEQRLRAIVSLIDQATQSGERLAALDIAGRAFGEPVRAALAQDNSFLDEMLRKADAMSAKQIVSQQDIGRAIQLRDRMEEAQRILAERWQPIMSDIAGLGTNFLANWTSVVETFSKLVELADKLYAALKQIPDLFASLGSSPVWKTLTDLTGRLGLNSTPESMGIQTGIDVQHQDATNRLGAALLNPDNARRAMGTATNVQSGARGDRSRNPATSTTADRNDPVDSAINTLQRHIEQQNADTKAVDQGAAAQARFRAEAAETSAVLANGGKETAEQASRFKELQQQAANAAEALAKVRVNSQISFDRQTALLSPEDVQIAQQLKSIYGNDIPAALNSTEAASMRVNNQLKSVGDAIRNDLSGPLTDFITGSKSAGDAFKAFADSMLRDLVRMGTEALIIKPLLGGLGSGLGIHAYAVGTDNAPGGLALVGEEGPELVRLPKGAAVYPAPQTTRMLQQIPHFADGGVMGSPGAAAPLIPSQSGGVFQMGDINITGATNGSPSQNRELAEQIAGHVKAAAAEMLGKELRTQMRPGGTIRSMLRR